MSFGILMVVALKLYIIFSSMVILKISILPIHKHEVFNILASLNFFTQYFVIFIIEVFHLLGVPNYFFRDFVNGIIVSFPVSS
jgi:hypothetical protein